MRVKKKISSEAIQVNSSEELAQVLAWFSEAGMFEMNADLLHELIETKTWFLRDEGSKIIYLAGDDEFEELFERVED